MSVNALTSISNIRNTVSQEEWRARCDLAAAYRLMDHEGVHDITHNHIVMRVPGEPDAFLIKPFEFSFDEVTASTLQKFDFSGHPRQEGIGLLKGGGIFHAAVFIARPDVACTIHSHSTANLAVACNKDGLLFINQHGLRFHGKIAFHTYAGLEFEKHVNEKIVRDLGDKSVLIMRNHGVLIAEDSLGAAFLAHHNYERACQEQVSALTAGLDKIVFIEKDVVNAAVAHWAKGDFRQENGGKDWASLLRKAARLFPDHAT